MRNEMKWDGSEKKKQMNEQNTNGKKEKEKK